MMMTCGGGDGMFVCKVMLDVLVFVAMTDND
jgi:hypothetical protein